MYEFLEGHGLIQMILLILFIGLQFKLSLKKAMLDFCVGIFLP